jgi:phosphoribosylformylglycinamidine synthase
MARIRRVYVIALGSGDGILAAAKAAGVPAVLLGYSGGAALTVEGLLSLPLSDIKTPTRTGCRPI